MSNITTHVLDTSRGRPANGVPVVLEHQVGNNWIFVGRGETDADGRCRTLVPAETAISPGVYRITFETEVYFQALQTEGFYPFVSVVFTIRDAAQHYHVPLLLSPFGYSTYRGS